MRSTLRAVPVFGSCPIFAMHFDELRIHGNGVRPMNGYKTGYAAGAADLTRNGAIRRKSVHQSRQLFA